MEQPIYNIGDKVWTLNDSRYNPKAEEVVIEGIFTIYETVKRDKLKFKEYVYYVLKMEKVSEYGWLKSSLLFTSKEALKESL